MTSPADQPTGGTGVYNPNNFLGTGFVTLKYLRANYYTNVQVDAFLQLKVSKSGDSMTGPLISSSTAQFISMVTPLISGPPIVSGAGTTYVSYPFDTMTIGPTLNDQLVTKAYVDSKISGNTMLPNCQAGTVSALPTVVATAQTLTGNANGALPVIDGVTLTTNNILLVVNQATGGQNGVYTVTAVGDSKNPFVLTRVPQFNSTGNMVAGSTTLVTAGTVNNNTNWKSLQSVTTVGTTDPMFQLQVFLSFTAPLNLSGSTVTFLTADTTHGGTGQSAWNAGDMSYYAAALDTKMTAIPAQTASVLYMTGTTPAWSNSPSLAGLTLTGALAMGGNAITSSGLIGSTTATWNGNAIGVAKGGTAMTTYTKGDIIFCNTTGANLTTLGIQAANSILNVSGTGVPAWTSTPTLAGLTMSGDITMNGNNIASSGMIGTSMATWNGLGIPIAKGGTGQTTYAQGDMIICPTVGTNLSRLARGADNTILGIDSGTHLPAWTGTPTLAGLTMTGTLVMTSNNVTSIGSIGSPSATWAGNSISISLGGTGQTTYAKGDMIYCDTVGAHLSKLNIGTGNQILSTDDITLLPKWVDLSTLGVSEIIGNANSVLASNTSGTGVLGSVTLSFSTALVAPGTLIVNQKTTLGDTLAADSISLQSSINAIAQFRTGVASNARMAWHTDGKSDHLFLSDNWQPITSVVDSAALGTILLDLKGTSGGFGVFTVSSGTTNTAPTTRFMVSNTVSTANNTLDDSLGNATFNGTVNITGNAAVTGSVTGTWAGGNIAPLKGGTGSSITFAANGGDILYSTNATAMTKLGAGSAGQFLSLTGNPPLPFWTTVTSGVSTVTASSATQIVASPTSGAVVLSLPNNLIAPDTLTVTHAFTALTTSDLKGIVTMESDASVAGALTVTGISDLKGNVTMEGTASVTGTLGVTGLVTLTTALPATSGGTGFKTYTTGDILISNATNVLTRLSASGDGKVLALASGIPAWTLPSSLGIVTVNGTTGQIVASTSTGVTTISLDPAIVTPGTLEVATALTADTTLTVKGLSTIGSTLADDSVALNAPKYASSTFLTGNAKGRLVWRANGIQDNLFLTDNWNPVTNARDHASLGTVAIRLVPTNPGIGAFTVLTGAVNTIPSVKFTVADTVSTVNNILDDGLGNFSASGSGSFASVVAPLISGGANTYTTYNFSTQAHVPTADDQLVSKFYVDQKAGGIITLPSSQAATTVALVPLAISAGDNKSLSGQTNAALPTIDGVTLTVGQNVLVKNQANGGQNGVYVVTTVGDGSNPYVLTRIATFNSTSNMLAGSVTSVMAGTTQANTQWKSTMTVAVLGTTDPSFVLFSVASYTFNAPIMVSGSSVTLPNVGTNFGGTGVTSWTANDMFYYVSGTAFTRIPTGTTNQILALNGSLAPTWTPASSLAISSVTGTSTSVLVNGGVGPVTSGGITLTVSNPFVTPGALTVTTSSTLSGAITANSTMTVANQTAFGTTLQTNQFMTVAPGSNGYGVALTGTLTAVSGTTDSVGLFVNPALVGPSSGTANSKCIHIGCNFSAGDGTTALAAGLYVGVGSGATTGITAGYGIYVERPQWGINRAAAFVDNLLVGRALSSIVASGALLTKNNTLDDGSTGIVTLNSRLIVNAAQGTGNSSYLLNVTSANLGLTAFNHQDIQNSSVPTGNGNNLQLRSVRTVTIGSINDSWRTADYYMQRIVDVVYQHGIAFSTDNATRTNPEFAIVFGGDGTTVLPQKIMTMDQNGVTQFTNNVNVTGTVAATGNVTATGNVSGTWTGVTIGVTKGGTGLTSCVLGDLLYGSALNTLNTLAIDNVGTKVLSVSSGIPAWTAISNIGLVGVSGTSFQVAASSIVSGVVTLSIPSDFRPPGTLAVLGGQSSFGTTLQTGIFSYSSPTAAFSIGTSISGGVQAAGTGGSIGLRIETILQGPASVSVAADLTSFYIYPSAVNGASGTINNFYGHYISAGDSKSSVSTITNAYGSFIQAPVYPATNTLALYADNAYIGRAIDGKVAAGTLKTKNNTLDDGSGGIVTLNSRLIVNSSQSLGNSSYLLNVSAATLGSTAFNLQGIQNNFLHTGNDDNIRHRAVRFASGSAWDSSNYYIQRFVDTVYLHGIQLGNTTGGVFDPQFAVVYGGDDVSVLPTKLMTMTSAGVTQFSNNVSTSGNLFASGSISTPRNVLDNGSGVASFNVPLAATSGGTGFAMFTIGDIIFASTTTAFSRLNSVADRVLTTTTGVSPTPQWTDRLTGFVTGLQTASTSRITLSSSQLSGGIYTGVVTLDIPSTFIAPGSISATTFLQVPTLSAFGSAIQSGVAFMNVQPPFPTTGDGIVVTGEMGATSTTDSAAISVKTVLHPADSGAAGAHSLRSILVAPNASKTPIGSPGAAVKRLCGIEITGGTSVGSGVTYQQAFGLYVLQPTSAITSNSIGAYISSLLVGATPADGASLPTSYLLSSNNINGTNILDDGTGNVTIVGQYTRMVNEIVTGQAAFGTNALVTGEFISIWPSQATGVRIGGGGPGLSGISRVEALKLDANMVSGGTLVQLHISNQISTTLGEAVGLWIDSGSSGTNLQNAYGAYVQKPTHGTNAVAGYFDNLFVGRPLSGDGKVANGVLRTANNTLDNGSGAATITGTLTINNINANGTVGTVGQVLTSNASSATTWSTQSFTEVILFPSSGTYTPQSFTVRRTTAICIGGGGGASSGFGNAGGTHGVGGGGGGAGGVAIRTWFGGIGTQTITVGGGGSGGTGTSGASGNNSAGFAGGASTIGTLLTGLGGNGGHDYAFTGNDPCLGAYAVASTYNGMTFGPVSGTQSGGNGERGDGSNAPDVPLGFPSGGGGGSGAFKVGTPAFGGNGGRIFTTASILDGGLGGESGGATHRIPAPGNSYLTFSSSNPGGGPTNYCGTGGGAGSIFFADVLNGAIGGTFGAGGGGGGYCHPTVGTNGGNGGNGAGGCVVIITEYTT